MGLPFFGLAAMTVGAHWKTYFFEQMPVSMGESASSPQAGYGPKH